MRYIVQQERQVSRWYDEASDRGTTVMAWQDIATVEVPPRTTRRTVIKKALTEANVQPNEDGSPPRLRALDAESAAVFEPESVQPPPEWKL